MKVAQFEHTGIFADALGVSLVEDFVDALEADINKVLGKGEIVIDDG